MSRANVADTHRKPDPVIAMNANERKNKALLKRIEQDQTPKTSRTRNFIILLISAVVTLGLPHVPYVQYLVRPLVLLSTLAHELGHGLTAILVGGRFDHFEMSANAAGVAYTATSGRFQSAAVSAGGLIGPAIAALALFAMGRSERWARIGLGAVALFFSLALVLVVRNLFGVFYVTALVAVLVALLKWGNAQVAQFSLVFVAVNLSVSVFTRGDYLFTEVARNGSSESPSDVANMADALFLPYWFWGALCGLISLLILSFGMWIYLRKSGSEPGESHLGSAAKTA